MGLNPAHTLGPWACLPAAVYRLFRWYTWLRLISGLGAGVFLDALQKRRGGESAEHVFPRSATPPLFSSRSLPFHSDSLYPCSAGKIQMFFFWRVLFFFSGGLDPFM